MEVGGILRLFAIYFLVGAFHGPYAVFCNNPEEKLSEKSAAVDAVETLETPKKSTVDTKVVENPAWRSGFVFQTPTWDDSHLASALFFVEDFCNAVTKNLFIEKLSDIYYEDVSKACSWYSHNLGSVINHFTPMYGPGPVDTRKEIARHLYQSILKSKEFDFYAEWMVKNIAAIVKSYKDMLMETAKLEKDQLESNTTVGPLKYGFVYNGYWWGEIIYRLSSEAYADSTFVASLNDLKNSLRKLLNMPEESDMETQVVEEEPAQEHSGATGSDVSEEELEVDDLADYGVVFKSPHWRHSYVASTLLFLKEFCKDVRDGKFKAIITDEEPTDLSIACSWIVHSLEPVSKNIHPRNEDGNPYAGALYAAEFHVYEAWLRKNIRGIEKSLGKMYKEISGLTKENIEAQVPAILSKYHFVLKDGWNPTGFQWDIGYRLMKLLRAFDYFNECIRDPTFSP